MKGWEERLIFLYCPRSRRNSNSARENQAIDDRRPRHLASEHAYINAEICPDDPLVLAAYLRDQANRIPRIQRQGTQVIEYLLISVYFSWAI